jgi:hypothetical protein
METFIIRLALLCSLVVSQITFSFSQSPLWQDKGRIVISSDGNEHDHDDWAATPLSLAIIAARGLQNRLTLYIYSDHIWGSNYEHPGVENYYAIDASDAGKVVFFLPGSRIPVLKCVMRS